MFLTTDGRLLTLAAMATALAWAAPAIRPPSVAPPTAPIALLGLAYIVTQPITATMTGLATLCV